LPLTRSALVVGGLSLLFANFVLVTDPDKLVNRIREMWFDSVLKWTPRDPGPDSPIVIDIGRDALAEFGEWPWPRELLAQLINKIADGKPKAMAVDILFPPRGPPADDEPLARAISRIPTVLGVVLDPEPSVPNSLPSSIAVIGKVRVPDMLVMNGAVLPAPLLLAKSQGLGILSLPTPEGEPVRTVPLLAAAGGTVLPGLSVEAARVGLGDGTIVASALPQTLRIGNLRIPLLSDALMRIHFVSLENRRARTIPADALMGGQIDPSQLGGKWVFLGASAPEAGGLRLTAVDPFLPSVQVHAEALDQVLTRHIPLREHWMTWAEAAATMILGLLAIVAVVTFPPGLAALLILIGCLLMIGIAIVSSNSLIWLIDPIVPSIAIVVAAQSAALAQFALVYRQRIAIERRFSQHLSPEVVRRIVANPGELKLAGEARTVTALFTDIEDFTALTERIGPEAVVSLLDRYIDIVADIIVAHGGMVDKIVGDAVHALFNAPLDLPDHAVKAVACAQDIIAATEQLRRQSELKAAQLGRTRVGIETGPAVLGDVGRGSKRDYTAYGRPLNMASRLQAVNKKFGSSIALGPSTVAALSDKVPLRRIGTVKLAGIEDEIELFEPVLQPDSKGDVIN
jgi:adenylate cyclase